MPVEPASLEDIPDVMAFEEGMDVERSVSRRFGCSRGTEAAGPR